MATASAATTSAISDATAKLPTSRSWPTTADTGSDRAYGMVATSGNPIPYLLTTVPSRPGTPASAGTVIDASSTSERVTCNDEFPSDEVTWPACTSSNTHAVPTNSQM